MLLLAHVLAPALLLSSTLPAGGDTPSHYATAQHLARTLLPQGRLHGWQPGALLGHPLQLYYFPLPFVLMSWLAPLVGLPVAFKLTMAAPALLLPLATWAALRACAWRFPAPLMGACASAVFLCVDENPIWGGTLASLLAGEFCFAWGLLFALLFLGSLYRAYTRGGSVGVPAVWLALTALSHGYAVLWAGASALFFLYGSRRPAKTLVFLVSVAGWAFALCAFFLLPLLVDWRATTPYADPWIEIGWRNLAPPLLWPTFALAVTALAVALLDARRAGGADQRALFLFHAACAAGLLAFVAPAFGVIDVRLIPCAQLALALLGATLLGRVLADQRAAPWWALGLVLVTLVTVASRSHTARAWARWDFAGLESKELWPAFVRLCARLQGDVGDPRVALEYSAEWGRGGSTRLGDLLPFLAGRAGLDGLYSQASLHAPAVYYLLSELCPRAPNPHRLQAYSTFDPATAIERLRLFNVREIVALSPELRAALAALPEVERAGEVPPFEIFRLREPGPGYVEALAFAPVRSSPSGWREKSARWLARKPAARAPLVFSDAPRFDVLERDAWLPPPEVPLPGADDVRVSARVSAEALDVQTSRPGHPLLVKVSYHPRWRVSGAEGPYLVSPAMMLIVPTQTHVRLWYAARTWVDQAGAALSLVALGGLSVLAWRAWRGHVPAPKPFRPKRVGPDGLPLPPRRWGASVPLVVALVLLAPRLVPRGPSRAEEGRELARLARAAYDAARYADAAEYASHALARLSQPDEQRALAALRERSLAAAAR